jgi:hypothetical protein
MFHDKAYDLRSGIVEQQVADTPELPAGVGGNHGPSDYIGCALRHTALLGFYVRMIRAYHVRPREADRRVVSRSFINLDDLTPGVLLPDRQLGSN